MKIATIHNALLSSCSYFVGVDVLILIDCGDNKAIIKQAEKSNIKAIFLTHCHYDHIYGLISVLNHIVYCSKSTFQGPKDEDMNFSYIMPDYPFHFEYDDMVVIIGEGKYIINCVEIEAVLTPRHSDDSMSYVIGNNMFTGDSYIPFAKVFTNWPRSNKEMANNSELRIKQLIQDRHLNVYPGNWTNE